MSLQSGSLGKFWLGPQEAKGAAAETYYGFLANLVDVAPGQMFRNVGPQVGGTFLPGGSIKTAAFSGGGVVMPPPLDDYLGWLLYAFAGTCSSNTLTDSVNYYEHWFPAAADNTAPGKYLTARRSIPGATTLYEQMEDLVPTRMLLTLTPGEYATMRYDVVGRTISSPDGSSWTHTPKDETTVPISCKGGIEFPDGTDISTATAVSIELANIVPDMRRVLTLGDYYPYDFPVLGRNITLSFQHLYEDKDLYSNFYWNGEAWTPVVYSTSFDVYVESAGNMTGTSTPFALKVWASNVDWACDPIRLAGGELIGMAVTGTVVRADGGMDWACMLRNLTASYTWPT
jgi:hypothetical protein